MKHHRVYAAFAALVLLVLIGASQSYAWQYNEHYLNNTGQTAYDLTKILPGELICTDTMMNLPFTQFNSLYFGGFTFFHWSGGQVPPGSYGHACFSTNGPARPFVALWTDASGNFIGVAGPVAYPSLGYDPVTGMVRIQIGNEWHTWNGTKYPPQAGNGLGGYVGPFTIGEAKICTTSVNRDLEELDSTLLYAPGLVWTTVPGLAGEVPAADTAETSLHVGKLRPGTNVYLYFTVVGQGKEAYDVVGYKVGPDGWVPSLTNWGLVVLVSLLLLSAIVILVRRKRQMA